MTTGFVPFTQELLTRFYGGTPKKSSRGFAYLQDGEPVVLVGVFLEGSIYVLFSEAKAGIKDDRPSIAKRRLIAQGARMVVDLVKTMGVKVYAHADCRMPGAEKLLKHLGFVCVDPEKQPEVFVWQA